MIWMAQKGFYGLFMIQILVPSQQVIFKYPIPTSLLFKHFTSHFREDCNS